MASKFNRMMNKASTSSIKSAIKSSISRTALVSIDISATYSLPNFPLPSRSNPSLLRRFLSRSSAELGCVQSLLPLHSTVAEARMTSRLSATSQTARSLSQGTLCRTSPGL